jgi:hypothetical protein
MSAPIQTDPARPSAASILADECLLALGASADDADTIAHRIRFLTGAARIEHGIKPAEWLSPKQLEQLLQLATLADRVAVRARAVLAEVAPR